jgi:hypothetical protein
VAAVIRSLVISGIAASGLLWGCNTPTVVAQESHTVATMQREARLPIRVQAGAKADPILHIWIKSYTPPRRGGVEGVVSLLSADKEAEVGRFVVFPSEPFVASDVRQERGYSFDAREALERLGGDTAALIARIRLAPLDPAIPTEGGEITLSRAELHPRT